MFNIINKWIITCTWLAYKTPGEAQESRNKDLKNVGKNYSGKYLNDNLLYGHLPQKITPLPEKKKESLFSKQVLELLTTVEPINDSFWKPFKSDEN